MHMASVCVCVSVCVLDRGVRKERESKGERKKDRETEKE